MGYHCRWRFATVARERAYTLEQNKAQFWINHDHAQSDAYKRPPAFYD